LAEPGLSLDSITTLESALFTFLPAFSFVARHPLLKSLLKMSGRFFGLSFSTFFKVFCSMMTTIIFQKSKKSMKNVFLEVSLFGHKMALIEKTRRSMNIFWPLYKKYFSQNKYFVQQYFFKMIKLDLAEP
jgi:hypothetical protein